VLSDERSPAAVPVASPADFAPLGSALAAPGFGASPSGGSDAEPTAAGGEIAVDSVDDVPLIANHTPTTAPAAPTIANTASGSRELRRRTISVFGPATRAT
jgi:hypothetical protein